MSSQKIRTPSFLFPIVLKIVKIIDPRWQGKFSSMGIEAFIEIANWYSIVTCMARSYK